MLWSIGMNESEATLLLGPVNYNYPPWSLFSMNPRPFIYQTTRGMPPSPLMIHSTPSNDHTNVKVYKEYIEMFPYQYSLLIITFLE